MSSAASAVPSADGVDTLPAPAEPVADRRPQRQPRYHVVLWNDEDHTFTYVVAMLEQLFGHPKERGFKLAKEVDRAGRAIVLTTTKEHAELKRDQIHAFGSDRLLARSKGAMKATIEAES
jgi:ATP-dependent Clp protease adaptor protein ClpS